MLGIHQEIQEEARKEVEQILGNDQTTPENLSQLKVVEKIIKETLRLFPIAPIMARTSTGEIKLGECYFHLYFAPQWSHNWRLCLSVALQFNGGKFKFIFL